jgi:hypothetical protein
VQVVDPAEQTFPYSGRVEFIEPEGAGSITAGRAEAWKSEYEKRIVRSAASSSRSLPIRMAQTPLALCATNRTLRERLHDEGERVRREIVEFATLNQAAMQSTKLIAKSLSHLKRPDAPASMKELG